MQQKIYAFRYISWIAVIALITGSGLMFLLGGYKTFMAIGYFFGLSDIYRTEEIPPQVSLINLSMATLVSAMDIFLFALILLIFAYGILHLFIATGDNQNIPLPEIMRINNITQLKTILAQVIIIILFVDFLESVITVGLKWVPLEALVTPLAILLLAAALRLMREHE